MNAKRTFQIGIASAAAALVALSGTSTAIAGSSGMTKASSRVVAKIAKTSGSTVPARCLNAELARSDKSWAAVWLVYSPQTGCPVGEGYYVVNKVNKRWQALPIGGSYVPCSVLKSELKAAGAPKSVFRDFKAGGYCVKGE